MDLLSYIRKVSMLESLKEEEQRRIAENMAIQHYSSETRVFSQGDIGDTLYIIASGEVKIFRSLANGGTEDVALLKEGDFFGEMSLISEERRSANAITYQDSTLLTLSKKDFDRLFQHNPDVVQRISDEYLNRLW